MKHFGNIIQLLICIMVLIVAALQHSGRLLGHDVSQPTETETEDKETAPGLRDDEGTLVLTTTGWASDIKGYAGEVPLEIRLKEGKIVSITALENHETPDFFEETTPLLSAWNGLSPKEALEKKVDAVSGATFSSRGIIETAHRGMKYLAEHPEEQGSVSWWKGLFSLPLNVLGGIVVALLAAIVPLFTSDRRYHIVQLILNVVVLGLWCGTFLSFSTLLSLTENGWNGWLSLLPIVLIVIAFIFPLFGKKQHYCTHACPFGSAQELCSKVTKRKWQIPSHWNKRLTTFRDVLWAVLMLLMLAGITFRWIDFELFTAFIFRSVSVVVIILAVLTLVLSVFVKRPYCRFICPTGTFVKIAENN